MVARSIVLNECDSGRSFVSLSYPGVDPMTLPTAATRLLLGTTSNPLFRYLAVETYYDDPG